jgi:hypothetical protein
MLESQKGQPLERYVPLEKGSACIESDPITNNTVIESVSDKNIVSGGDKKHYQKL